MEYLLGGERPPVGRHRGRMVAGDRKESLTIHTAAGAVHQHQRQRRANYEAAEPSYPRPKTVGAHRSPPQKSCGQLRGTDERHSWFDSSRNFRFESPISTRLVDQTASFGKSLAWFGSVLN